MMNDHIGRMPKTVREENRDCQLGRHLFYNAERIIRDAAWGWEEQHRHSLSTQQSLVNTLTGNLKKYCEEDPVNTAYRWQTRIAYPVSVIAASREALHLRLEYVQANLASGGETLYLALITVKPDAVDGYNVEVEAYRDRDDEPGEISRLCDRLDEHDPFVRFVREGFLAALRMRGGQGEKFSE